MSENTPENSGVRRPGLDIPMRARSRLLPQFRPNPDAFGEATEGMARFMGTPQFILWMTLFCVFWVAWNTLAPEPWRFDSAALGFTALTLMLSLQASYAAPLLLLAQNRQDDRDRVSLREDRNRAERNLADTEYLTRELAGLRIALQDVATRDYVRGEMRSAVEDITADLRQEIERELREEIRAELLEELGHAPTEPRKTKKKKDRPGRESRDRDSREGGTRHHRPDDGQETPHTTTLAIIAAEEAAEARRAEQASQARQASQDLGPDQTEHAAHPDQTPEDPTSR